MPRRINRKPPAGSAPVFAALADETRLRLVGRLCAEGPASITQLAAGFDITRQAVTKHLRIIERSGLAQCRRRGRETLWQIERAKIVEAREYLDAISRQWDTKLERLRALVEES